MVFINSRTTDDMGEAHHTAPLHHVQSHWCVVSHDALECQIDGVLIPLSPGEGFHLIAGKAVNRAWEIVSLVTCAPRSQLNYISLH